MLAVRIVTFVESTVTLHAHQDAQLFVRVERGDPALDDQAARGAEVLAAVVVEFSDLLCPVHRRAPRWVIARSGGRAVERGVMEERSTASSPLR